MPTPNQPENGSGNSGAETTRQVRRLRKQLSECREELGHVQTALQEKSVALREERAHSEGLGRLLDNAHDRLDEAGLNDPLEFPVSRDAIHLYDEIETPATFEEIMELATGELECSSEEAAGLLAELVEEGVLVRGEDTGSYVSSGHEPWF